VTDPDRDFVTLSVPEMVEATYVVTTSSPPADLEATAAEVAQSLPEPLRSVALQMLGSSLMNVSVIAADQAPPLPLDLLRVFGAGPAQLGAAANASHIVICQAVFRPGWLPAHEWHARAVAAALAQQLHGTLIDTSTPRILEPAVASQSLPDADGRMALTRWVLVPQSPGERGVWMTTKGLDRFGLPELQVIDVPPALAGPWTGRLRRVGRGVPRAGLRGPVRHARHHDPATLEQPAAAPSAADPPCREGAEDRRRGQQDAGAAQCRCGIAGERGAQPLQRPVPG